MGTVLESIDLKHGTGTAVPVLFLADGKACVPSGEIMCRDWHEGVSGDGKAPKRVFR